MRSNNTYIQYPQGADAVMDILDLVVDREFVGCGESFGIELLLCLTSVSMSKR